MKPDFIMRQGSMGGPPEGWGVVSLLVVVQSTVVGVVVDTAGGVVASDSYASTLPAVVMDAKVTTTKATRLSQLASIACSIWFANSAARLVTPAGRAAFAAE